MKIKNPNFKTDAQLFVEKHQADIDAFVAGLPVNQEFVTIEEVRQAFAPLMGEAPEDITEGRIHEVLAVLKHEVVD